MVFCYKIITDYRRSSSISPKRRSPIRNLQKAPSALSDVIRSYEDESVIDSIPEREWRLLGALAKKKEEDAEREKLAQQFRQMWQKEKEEREMVEAETSLEYKQYLLKKRLQERSLHEYKQIQRSIDQKIKSGVLMDSIRHKDRRTRDLLAWREDKKASELLDRAITEESRAALAADRRSKQIAAEEWKKRLEFLHTQTRAKDAGSRRIAMLKEAAQRQAIANTLNSWESCMLRQEILALDAAKRASHAAHAALTSERSEALARDRENRVLRARRVAAVTAQMRDDLKARK